MVLCMRLGFAQGVDGLVTDASCHSYGKTEGTKLDFLNEMSGIGHCALHPEYYQFCGNTCTNPETGKVL